MSGCITITWGDVCENHARMQKIGLLATRGFSIEELEHARDYFENSELIKLEMKDEKAAVLVIRNGCRALGGDSRAIFAELSALNWDKKAKMYGRVVNKIARHNLCFSDVSQESDFENGKGTVVSWEKVTLLNGIRKMLPLFLGESGENLQAEGNYYYNARKCYIGFHGDGERKKVCALRLGESMPLFYQWYYQNKPVGEQTKIILNDGDMYIMSEKAVGHDWKKRGIYTLRHAAGFKIEEDAKKKKV